MRRMQIVALAAALMFMAVGWIGPAEAAEPVNAKVTDLKGVTNQVDDVVYWFEVHQPAGSAEPSGMEGGEGGLFYTEERFFPLKEKGEAVWRLDFKDLKSVEIAPAVKDGEDIINPVVLTLSDGTVHRDRFKLRYQGMIKGKVEKVFGFSLPVNQVKEIVFE